MAATAAVAQPPAVCLHVVAYAGCGLDWSNCCIFNLYPGRGPVVQAQPSWPVTCTATCYAAVTVQDVVTTGNYAAEGPHFLDWKALAEQGNVSMAAVPMHSCNKPVAVLCLASKQVCDHIIWEAQQRSIHAASSSSADTFIMAVDCVQSCASVRKRLCICTGTAGSRAAWP